MSRMRLLQACLGTMLFLLLVASAFAQPALASTVVSQVGTPTPRATETPTGTLSADVSTALLAIGDLAPGFEAITDAELDKLGLSAEALGSRYSTSKPSRAGYIEPTKPTIVMHVLLYPMGTLERLAYDWLLDPKTGPDALAQFWMGNNTQITDLTLIPGMDKLGDRSLGVTIVSCTPGFIGRTSVNMQNKRYPSSTIGDPCASNTRAVRADIVMERRESALSMVAVMYPEGEQPNGDAVALAQLIDKRLLSALAKAKPLAGAAQAPAEWPALIDANFDTNANGWLTGEKKDEYGRINRSIKDGKYRLDAKADKGVVWRTLPSSKSVSNFYVSVDAQRVEGLKSATYGLLFCYDGANYGYFRIRDDQLFGVDIRHQSKWKTIKEWTRATAIRPGQVNRLTVRGEGPRFAFFINDQLVAQLLINELAAGKPGVVIELNGGESALYEFDNFEVRALPDALRIDGSEPLSLDPVLADDAGSSAYLVEIFSGLVTFDRDLKVVPDLAERWEVSEDGTAYTFHLRPNAKFHDGRPVTAQDIQYSLERAADPATQSPTAATYLGDIVGVNDKLSGKAKTIGGLQVVDDRTIRLTIDAPKTYFLSKLAHPVAAVVDKTNVERDGANWTTKPNGTGPYKLKEYAAKQRLVLERNDNFYLDPKPQITRVVFVLTAADLGDYTNGDLDVFAVGAATAGRVRDPKDPLSKEAVLLSELSTRFIVFNVRKPPFDDPKVRQAFALAIDRQKIIDEQAAQIPLLSKSILPLAMPGYNAELPDIAYDPARARQLLAESKYAGQLPKIVWRKRSTDAEVQAIADMLKANLGVDIVFQVDDTATFYANLQKSENPYNAFVYGWVADYPDPEDFIAVLFQSNSANNESGYTDAQVDAWIAQAAVEPDKNRRMQLYQQAEAKILQDWAVVPLTQGRELWLVKPYVKDLPFPAMPLPRLRYAYFVGVTRE